MSTDQQTRRTEIRKEGAREIHTARVFDAPRDRVYAVFNDPKLIPEWWGNETKVETMDVRTGGEWRFVARFGEHEVAFGGEYREVTPPERVVRTWSNATPTGGSFVETIEFEELGEQTRLTTTVVCDSEADRDAQYSGMEYGIEPGYARFDEVLARHAG